MRLSEHAYRTISCIRGPLLFVDRVMEARIGEVVRIEGPEGLVLDGEVLRIEQETVLIQVYGETRGLDIGRTRVCFSDAVKRIPVSEECLGRIFDGSFRPLDGEPLFYATEAQPVTSRAINPVARARPEEFIETGIAAIDVLNTLVKGQKLPIFSCAGLPSKELAADILRHSGLAGREGFAVVFVALGLTGREYAYYQEAIETLHKPFVAIVNLAERPVVERLLAPRVGLTIAEYLAFEQGRDVLVLVSDMVNYCDALREVSTAREELPGRRGYPGYMYSDLASLYERAGRIKGREGSVTMLPVVTMPEDDITHPIPDLTGYITEGQIVLSRDLHAHGIYPPIDVLPSLSRLMQQGIGKDRTREDHRQVADLLYRNYARGREVRKLEAIVGRDGLAKHDQVMLDFGHAFEKQFIAQGEQRRSVAESLDVGLALLEEYGVIPHAASDPHQPAPA